MIGTTALRLLCSVATVRRKRKSVEATARIRHLIALDAANVMRRLLARHQEMVALFSRLRDRNPMLETVKSWFLTISFADLSILSPSEQGAVNAFYMKLDELRWYLQYTEDMPNQVQLRVAQHVLALELAHRKLSAVIGPPDAEGAPVVDAEVVG